MLGKYLFFLCSPLLPEVSAVGCIWRQDTELACPFICYSVVFLEASQEFSGTSVLTVDASWRAQSAAWFNEKTKLEGTLKFYPSK